MLFLYLLLFYSDQPSQDRAIDVQAYHYRITLSDTSDRIEGQARIQLRTDRPSLSQITLDLVGPQGDKGMRVSGVRCDQKQLAFRQDEQRLTIDLDQPAASGSTLELEISYAGIPLDGLIISTNKHGARTFFADNWPNRAHHWIPCVDHPADKARCSFEVIAPSHYQVIANGVQHESTDLADGMRRTAYTSPVDLPTKVMVIGVARFAVQHLGATEGVPLSTWVFPEDRDRGFEGYRVAQDVMVYLTAYLGPFPYRELASVQSRTKFGGMENAGAIFYNEQALDRPLGGLVAHEMAHQWFGDSVSEQDWPHIWLSEGFATYFSWRYQAYADGEASLVENLAAARAKILEAKQGNAKPIVRQEADLMGLLDANSYQRGGYVLHMLNLKIGEAAFQRCIHAYLERFHDRNATTEQFQEVVETTVGTSLQRFFDQWLHRPELPNLALTWSWSKASRQLTIEAKQDPDHWFQLDLPILIKEDGSDTLHTLALDGPDVKLTLSTNEPLSLVANPNGDILIESLTLDKR